MPRKVSSYVNELKGTPKDQREPILNINTYTRREFIKNLIGWTSAGVTAGAIGGGVGSFLLFGDKDNEEKTKTPAYRMPGREEKLPVKEMEVVTGRKVNCNNFSAGSHLRIQTEYDITGNGRPDAVELHLYSESLDTSQKDFEKMVKRLEGAEIVGLTEQPVDSKLPIGDPNRRKGSYPTLIVREKGEYVIKTLFRGVTKYAKESK